VRLNTSGTCEDLRLQGIELIEGQRFMLIDDELSAAGTAAFSAEEHLWVAVVDWKEVVSSS
jgi:hypothetical protein